jgi:hypothetical protein
MIRLDPPIKSVDTIHAETSRTRAPDRHSMDPPVKPEDDTGLL